MNTAILEVFYNSIDKRYKVGRLANENRKIYFEYDEEFLKTNIELSPYKLPLKKGLFENSDNMFDGLHGLFDDCLPDGWGRLIMDRHLVSQGYSLASITPLDRLMLIGQYGIGALEFEPIIQNKLESKNINLDELASSSLEILKGVDEKDIEVLIANNGSSSGARPKIMVQINKDNHILSGDRDLKNLEYEHYMVKFPSSIDHKDIGKLEYVYSLMAKDAGVDIPNTKLLEGKDNSYFAIKRFDRIKDKKVHIHSLSGMAHTNFRIPSVDYDDILTLTLNLTKDINEVSKVYRLAVFNLFTHNRDDHAKNFSYLLDSSNKWKFSPAYDLTFSYGLGGEHSTTYLNEGANPTKDHLEKLAIKHNIKNYKEICDKTKSVVSKFMQYAKEVDISSKYAKEVYKEIVKTM